MKPKAVALSILMSVGYALPPATCGLDLHLPGALPTSFQEHEAKATSPQGGPRGKRLILTDGSYQIVRSYERRGERVRYYSLERSAWEEIPADLVDWAATRKVEGEELRAEQELAERARQAAQSTLVTDLNVGASIVVSEGLFLPESVGTWILDREKNTLIDVSQAPAQVNADKKRIIARIFMPVPILASKQNVEIEGATSQTRLLTTQPEFFMRTADDREPEIQLIRAEVKGKKRRVQVISTHLTGEHTTDSNDLPLQRWQLAKRVYRFTLGQSLEAGEYVLAEYLPGEGMSLYLWDFGIDAPSGGSKEKD